MKGRANITRTVPALFVLFVGYFYFSAQFNMSSAGRHVRRNDVRHTVKGKRHARTHRSKGALVLAPATRQRRPRIRAGNAKRQDATERGEFGEGGFTTGDRRGLARSKRPR